MNPLELRLKLTKPPAIPECSKIDPDKAEKIFFPASTVAGTPTQENKYYDHKSMSKARKFCNKCEAYQWCRDSFMHERFGIFFGTSPADRVRLRMNNGNL